MEIQIASETQSQGQLSESQLIYNGGESETKEQCMMCQQNLIQALNQSLKSKYQSMDNSDRQYRDTIDCLVYSIPSADQVNAKEMVYKSEDHQYFKRLYFQVDLKQMIQELKQFYKYHKDCPMHFGSNEDKNVFKIIFRFYDQYRKNQYKKIKRRLKYEDNISLSTMKQSSDMYQGWGFQTSSNINEIKSNLLSTFVKQSHDQTHFQLKNICQRIQKKLGKLKMLSFKPRDCGEDLNNQKKFIQFLKNEENKLNARNEKASFKDETSCKNKIKDIVEKQFSQISKQKQIMQCKNKIKIKRIISVPKETFSKLKQVKVSRQKSIQKFGQQYQQPKKIEKSKSLKLNNKGIRIKKINSQYQGALQNKLVEQKTRKGSLKVIKRDLSRSNSKHSTNDKQIKPTDDKSRESSKKIIQQDNPFSVKIQNFETLKPISIHKRPKVDIKLRNRSTRDQNNFSQEKKAQRQQKLNKIISVKLNTNNLFRTKY